MKNIGLTAQDFRLIDSIFKQFPHTYYVFGSRIKGTYRPFSDLDILVKDTITLSQLAEIKEAFDNSDLPFKIDICRDTDLDARFRGLIHQGAYPWTALRPAEKND